MIYKAVEAVGWVPEKGTFEVHCRNPFSGQITVIERKGAEADELYEGVKKWVDGWLIQEALPQLTETERELMLCGFVLY